MSEYLDRDRSELGDGLLDETLDEAAELALQRSQATGRVVAVVAMSGSDELAVYDVLPDGLELAGRVLAEHPTPSLALDLELELDDD